MTNYATVDELKTFLGIAPGDPAPANAEPYLRIASGLVADTIAGAVYPVAAGLPTKAEHITATRDATCTQVEAWITTGIDPRLGVQQVAPTVKSKGLAGATVTYADAVRDPQVYALASGNVLIENAWGILNRAGLVSAKVGSATGGRMDQFFTPYPPYDLT